MSPIIKPLGLYLHIPFCPYRCHYCDFLSFTGQESFIPRYVERIIEDLRHYGGLLSSREIVSVFFGGGTPSLLSHGQIHKILNAVSRNFALADHAEITLESNPGTLTPEKLSGYRESGVNRLSIGVQAIQDRHLQRMGRIHSAQEARDAFSMARKAGFENINVDVIFGLPEQTFNQWEETLGEITALNPEHISAYGLQVEEGTPFWKDQKRGNLPLPDEELQAEMYDFLRDHLAHSGHHQYEISNFAKPGRECGHNLIYWRNEEYLGLGAGAFSYLDKRRFWMTRNFSEYLAGKKTEAGSEILSGSGEMGETMMLGLRLLCGMEEERFEKRFGEKLTSIYGPIIRKFKAAGLMDQTDKTVKLTPRGILLANEVIREFI